MPNTSSAQDWISQNDHYHVSQGLFEELLDFTGSKTPPETQSKTSESVGDEWSALTKELIDTLPRVWTRGLLYLLVVQAGIVLPWAMLSKVDETGTARGRLEPKGKTVTLDAPVEGTVSEIKVKEGSHVLAGQSLLELESELVDSQLQEIQRKLEGQLNRLAQLELLKNQLVLTIRAQQQQNKAQELEKLTQVEQARQNFDSLKTASNVQKEEKLAQVVQAQQNLKHSQTAYSLEEIRLGKSLRELERYRELWKTGAVAEIKVVEQEDLSRERQELRDRARSDLELARLRLKEQRSSYQKIFLQAASDIRQAQLRLQEQQRSYQSLIHSGELAVFKAEEQLKDLETQVTTLKAEIAQSKSQIQSLEFQLKQRVLEAPVSGTVFELSIQRAGAVVQPGEMIAEIAPNGSSYVLRAQIATTESGSLRVGMPVKMKFDAYPFQDYGVVEGKLIQISPTSKVTETASGAIATYDLEIELKQPCIQTSKGCVALTPGQTATAEVIVRQRRIIDFVLDPFKKLQKGGLEL